LETKSSRENYSLCIFNPSSPISNEKSIALEDENQHVIGKSMGEEGLKHNTTITSLLVDSKLSPMREQIGQ
jgi:hypothetical protein